MISKEAINLIDIIRMGYICDPQECGLEEVKGICNMLKCDDFHEACVMAMEALEMQEPKKPTHHKQPIRLDIETLDVWEYDVCPICGFTVRMEYDNFCYNCGRPLDWSEEE